MIDTTGETTSKRKLVLRELGGFDRSMPSERSDDSFYDLLQLRPARGSLEQPDLISLLLTIVES